MQSLEDKLGYKFRNSLLMAEAMTHPSLAYESQRPHFDNQRLEFLGDAVLQLVLTEHLFQLFPDFPEGRLTKLRARLVSRRALSRFAGELALGEHVLLGKGEEATGGRRRSSTLADAFEALLGAVYLDNGPDAVREIVLRACSAEIAALAASPEERNPKGGIAGSAAGDGCGGPRLSDRCGKRTRPSQGVSGGGRLAREAARTRQGQEQEGGGGAGRRGCIAVALVVARPRREERRRVRVALPARESAATRDRLDAVAETCPEPAAGVRAAGRS